MNTQFASRLRISALASASIGLVITSPALAQGQDSDNDIGSAEPIVVTGSRIRGIEPTGSNVIAISSDDIAREPVMSTNDLVRRVPQIVSLGTNRNGGAAQNGAANATRAAGINLRGISTNATLLLYDGKRFPQQGTQGQYIDPSVIPSIALERVEVVADGASAIYGSDAIAGVVNFILRKNFDGAEMRVRAGFTDSHYNEKQVAGIVGKRWDSGSIMAAGEYRKSTALLARDVDFYRDDNTDRGGRDLRGNNCMPGTLTAGGQTYAIPAGGVTAANVGSLVAGTANLCELNRYGDLLPSEERYSFVGHATQDLASNVRVFADGFYSHRKGKISSIYTINAIVPDTNPFFVSPDPAATSVRVSTSLVPLIGPEVNPYYGTFWNVTGGIEVEPFADWKVTAYYEHGESEDKADRRSAGINSGALAAALADTDPATALNVFGGPNNPATLAAIRDRLFVIYGSTKLDVFNVQADGSLFDLPGGAVRMAAGGEYRKEYTFTDLISGSSVGSTSTAAGGSRNVKAIFGELFIPFFGTDNATPGLEELSLSVAGRYEKYSDFGSTSNPKIGLTYRPVDTLTFRASYGTSFRAPTFTETSELAGGAGLYYDLLPGPSGLIWGIGIAGGNPDLKPETATTWSVGAEWRPVHNVQASLTYFNIDYKDQIIGLRRTPGLLTNPLYASYRNMSPTASEVSALMNSGLPINSTIDTTNVQYISDGRRQNLGRTKMNGLDFVLSGQFDAGDVTVNAGIQGTYNISFDFEAVQGAGLENKVGYINFPQKFRFQADIGAEWEAFSARLVWNYLDGYKNDTLTPVQKISNYNTFDLNLGWNVNDRFSFGIDVRNLFDEKPPFADLQGGYDPQGANPLPRVIAVTAGVKM
ncbi:MAG: TonB-dependent receptor [Sphingomonadaceae bacterium]